MLAGFAFALAANRAVAQDMGDAKVGFAFAERVCAERHAVRAGEVNSPHSQVPSFQSVANISGMTSTALRVWFQSLILQCQISSSRWRIATTSSLTFSA